MKKCSKCTKEKSFSEFNKNKSKADGYQSICRECGQKNSKQYYLDNKSTMVKQIYAKNQSRKLKNKQIVFDYLLTKECVDCGNNNPLVLEFDHINPSDKFKEVGMLVHEGYSIKTIFNEITKCEIRCANCHRIKTATDQKWYKFQPRI